MGKGAAEDADNSQLYVVAPPGVIEKSELFLFWVVVALHGSSWPGWVGRESLEVRQRGDDLCKDIWKHSKALAEALESYCSLGPYYHCNIGFYKKEEADDFMVKLQEIATCADWYRPKGRPMKIISGVFELCELYKQFSQSPSYDGRIEFVHTAISITSPDVTEDQVRHEVDGWIRRMKSIDKIKEFPFSQDTPKS
ncbi:hypothetical protein FE236_02100 [Mariprofundus erugo]|uniref:hypothetical protein n=1 Tax=Mariprofundus erugo TaxID=2528639 RepID=UPI0010FE5152|nr:hypothetical protein [Mariprofundus erugo]TLS77914.1 hypothetical protein FE236_02100 [Mariprofundus erugo]